jgi:hypothetical protein
MRHSEPDGGTCFCLHDVFYDKNGKADGWGDTCLCVGDSPEDVIKALELMLSDAKKFKDDILDYEATP